MPNLIGTKPDQVPTNGMLGTLAFQSAESPRVGSLRNDGQSDLAGTVLVGATSNALGTSLAIGGEASENNNGTPSKLVNQADIGTGPDQVPINQYLGELAYLDKNNFVINPQASVAPQQVGALVFQLTSDTTLLIKVRGSDGIVRSVSLTLA